MNLDTQKSIEDLWNARRHGFVDFGSIRFEVCADVAFRKILVHSRSKLLPVEFYSVGALVEGMPKVKELLRIGDSRLRSLFSVFNCVSTPVSHVSDSDGSLIVRPSEQFGSTFYQYTNEAGFLVVIVVRPSGDLFYQRLSDPSMLAYVLANQVGFLIVSPSDDGVFVSPDKQLKFSFVEDNLKVLGDFSKE